MYGSIWANGSGAGGGLLGSKLQLQNGVLLSASLVSIADGANNPTKVKVSNLSTQLEGLTFVGDGTITSNGVLTVKGAGGNIASFRNSSNTEVASVTSNGGCVFANSGSIGGTAISNQQIQSNLGPNKINFAAVSYSVSDIAGVYNNASVVFAVRSNNKGFIIPQMSTATFNGIAAKEEGLLAWDTTRSGVIMYDSFAATIYRYGKEILTGAISSGAGQWQLGKVSSITDGSFTALGLDFQLNVSVDGNEYFIPVSSTLIP